MALDRDGYVRAKGPDGWTVEHRLIMAIHLGRPLTADEVVHHRNGDRTDNRLENLMLMTRREHALFHGFPGKRGGGPISGSLDRLEAMYGQRAPTERAARGKRGKQPEGQPEERR